MISGTSATAAAAAIFFSRRRDLIHEWECFPDFHPEKVAFVLSRWDVGDGGGFDHRGYIFEGHVGKRLRVNVASDDAHILNTTEAKMQLQKKNSSGRPKEMREITSGSG